MKTCSAFLLSAVLMMACNTEQPGAEAKSGNSEPAAPSASQATASPCGQEAEKQPGDAGLAGPSSLSSQSTKAASQDAQTARQESVEKAKGKGRVSLNERLDKATEEGRALSKVLGRNDRADPLAAEASPAAPTPVTMEVKEGGDPALALASYLAPGYRYGFLVWPDRWSRWIKTGLPTFGVDRKKLVETLFKGRDVLADPLEAVALAFLGQGAEPIGNSLRHRDSTRPLVIAVMGPSPIYNSPTELAGMALATPATLDAPTLSHRLVIPATDSGLLAAEVVAYLESNGVKADSKMAQALGIKNGSVFLPAQSRGNYLVVIADKGAVRVEVVARAWFLDPTDEHDMERLRQAVTMHPLSDEVVTELT